MRLFKGRPIFKGFKFTEYEMPIDLSGADPGGGGGMVLDPLGPEDVYRLFNIGPKSGDTHTHTHTHTLPFKVFVCRPIDLSWTNEQ